MARLERYLAGLATLSTIAATEAHACAAAIPHPARMPVCDVPLARPDESIVAVRVDDGGLISPVPLPGKRPKYWRTFTRVTDVSVTAGERPYYVVVISSGDSVIWRFTGDVSTVSRVVVLGSDLLGAKHAGVVGLPRHKIHFARTSAKAVVTEHEVLSSCGFERTACYPGHYFYRFPDPENPGLAILKQVRLWDLFQSEKNTFQAPNAGLVPQNYLEEAKFAHLKGRVWSVLLHEQVTEGRASADDGPVTFTAQDVITPDQVE